MKKLKLFLWFAGLLTLCGSASAEPVSAAFAAFGSWVASASIPTILAAAASTVSIISTLSSGKQQQQNYAATGQAQNEQSLVAADAAENTADQLDAQAGQQRAAGQRRAQEQRRRSALAASNLQARAGGGGLDPSILGLTGDIAGEGEYNALTNLYEAEETARGAEGQAGTQRTQAQLYRMQGAASMQRAAASGEAASTASKYNTASSIFSAGSTLFSKFGNGGPGAADPVDSYRYTNRGTGD